MLPPQVLQTPQHTWGRTQVRAHCDTRAMRATTRGGELWIEGGSRALLSSYRLCDTSESAAQPIMASISEMSGVSPPASASAATSESSMESSSSSATDDSPDGPESVEGPAERAGGAATTSVICLSAAKERPPISMSDSRSGRSRGGGGWRGARVAESMPARGAYWPKVAVVPKRSPACNAARSCSVSGKRPPCARPPSASSRSLRLRWPSRLQSSSTKPPPSEPKGENATARKLTTLPLAASVTRTCRVKWWCGIATSSASASSSSSGTPRRDRVCTYLFDRLIRREKCSSACDCATALVASSGDSGDNSACEQTCSSRCRSASLSSISAISSAGDECE
mmetsp:Transcript_16756/g.53718  ORF Transcript_16756/g.53718 Transcript_16756/m.53718 type:complete len:340 (+) Transcript_16756:197-1216(+)